MPQQGRGGASHIQRWMVAWWTPLGVHPGWYTACLQTATTATPVLYTLENCHATLKGYRYSSSRLYESSWIISALNWGRTHREGNATSSTRADGVIVQYSLWMD